MNVCVNSKPLHLRQTSLIDSWKIVTYFICFIGFSVKMKLAVHVFFRGDFFILILILCMSQLTKLSNKQREYLVSYL